MPEPYLFRNARIMLPVAIVQTTIYLFLNHFPLFPSHLLPLTPLDRAIPFWPWTLWPYLGLIAAQATLPLVIRSRIVFREMLCAYIPAMVITFLIFLFFPTCYPRTAILEGDSCTAIVFRLLLQADSPQCCFPSGHLVGPAIVCWGLWRDARPWCRSIVLLFPLFSLSILTTKQHYIWDLAGALALAALAITITHLFRRQPAPRPTLT